MINWDLIISDFNLKGTYGHFLVLDSHGLHLDLVFYHYDKFDYDPYLWEKYFPTLNPHSVLSRLYVVKSVKMNRKFDNFSCVIVLSRKNFFTRFFKSNKYYFDVH